MHKLLIRKEATAKGFSDPDGEVAEAMKQIRMKRAGSFKRKRTQSQSQLDCGKAAKRR